VAILIAAAAVSLSVLHAASVAQQDSQNEAKILKDIRGLECVNSNYCTSWKAG
jgi:hypothetical protein